MFSSLITKRSSNPPKNSVHVIGLQDVTATVDKTPLCKIWKSADPNNVVLNFTEYFKCPDTEFSICGRLYFAAFFVIKLENIQTVNYVELEAVLHLVKTLKTVLSLTIIFKIDAKWNTQNSGGSIFTARRCNNACDGCPAVTSRCCVKMDNVNGTSRFSAQCMATGGCYTVWKGISVSLKIKARRVWNCPKLSNDTPFTRVRELQFTRCKRGFSSADDRRQSITPSIHIWRAWRDAARRAGPSASAETLGSAQVRTD